MGGRVVRLAHDLDDVALKIAYAKANWRGLHHEYPAEMREPLAEV